MSSASWGAYGLRLPGLPVSAGLVAVQRDAPVVRLVGQPLLAADPHRPPIDQVMNTVAEIDLVERRATITVPAGLPDDELLHPWATRVLADFAAHDGAAVLHAGVVAGAKGAVMLMGAREAGKSTLVAEAALKGMDVLSDDLAVVRSGQVSAGPRFIDLRESSAARVAERSAVRSARHGTRSRMALPAGRPSAPVVAVVELEWAPCGEVDLVPMPVRERFTRLLPHASFETPSAQAGALLSVAAVPAYRLRRRKHWDGLASALQVIRELGGG